MPFAFLVLPLLLAPFLSPGDPPGSGEGPSADYWFFVGSETEPGIQLVRFGPEGVRVESRLGTDLGEGGARGLVVSPDGGQLYAVTGDGTEDGELWKYRLGREGATAARLEDGPVRLGPLSTSLGISPDGSFVFAPNFNLYGSHDPSTLSVVFGPDLLEVERVELCIMPHGAGISPSGNHVYSVCMMDDQVVEVDALSMEVVRRFSVSQGREGPLPADWERGGPGTGAPGAGDPAGSALRTPGSSTGMTCAPTWAEPSRDGRWLWVACNATDEIHQIDLDAWRLGRTLRTGRGPHLLAVTPDGSRLLSTLRQGSEVEVFDLAEGFSLARIPTSVPGARGVVVTPDGRYALVSVEGTPETGGRVEILDLEALEWVAELEVASGAAPLAFWRTSEP